MATMQSKPIMSSKPSSAMQSIPGTYNTVSKVYNAPLNNSAYSTGINSKTGAPATPNMSTQVLGTRDTGGGSYSPPPPQTYYDQGTGRTFGSYDDFTREIESVYNPAFDYLNQAESAVRADHPSALAAAESEYKTNVSALGNQRDTAKGALDQQQRRTDTTHENALADARRIFQEKQIGGVQRFGGSSSAGGAFSELLAREQARQFGAEGRQYADISAQIQFQRDNIDKEYQTGALQLEQQKQTAISNATRDFQNKLLQIANSRAMLGQAKAEARLGALQQLRSEVFAIEQQNRQFAQSLEAQRQSALLSLGNFNQYANSALGQSGGLVDQYNPNAQLSSAYSAGQGLGQRPTSTNLIGARRPEELYGYTNPNDPYRLGQ